MKKSKDSRDVFAVFKKGSFMEDASFGEKFRYWFKNVYWFHFKYQTLLVVLFAFCAFFFAKDVFFREYNDIDYILGGNVFASYDTLDAMEARIAGLIETDDGRAPLIGKQLLSTRSVVGDGTGMQGIDEYSSANIQKISVCMAEDEILLFFLDKNYAEWYANAGAFEPLETFGIESDNKFFVRVDTAPLFSDLEFSHTDGIYAAIKVISPGRRKDERIMKKYDIAAHVLSGILTEKAG